MTLEELAKLDFIYWISEIPEDDERWFRMLELKKEICPDFDGWLLQKGLERTPANALNYLSERYEAVYGERDRLEAEKANREMHEASDRLFWHLGFERNMRVYKNNPYKGPLTIGHYVGIKEKPEDDPLDYKDYVIGEIRDYETDENGNIIKLFLEKYNGETIVVPTEYTYRIY